MTQIRTFSGFFLLFSLSIFFLSSCGVPANRNLPELAPSMVKAYKEVVVPGDAAARMATGVHVNKADFYSLVVTGKIEVQAMRGPHLVGGASLSDPESLLGVFIGEKAQVVPPVNATLGAQDTGEIKLYNKSDKYPNQMHGQFSVTIIVWQTRDLTYISNFFQRAKSLNPSSRELKDLHYQVELLKTYIAESQAAGVYHGNTEEKGGTQLPQAEITAENTDVGSGNAAPSIEITAKQSKADGTDDDKTATIPAVASNAQATTPDVVAVETPHEKDIVEAPPKKDTAETVPEEDTAEMVAVKQDDGNVGPAVAVSDQSAPLMLIVSPRDNQKITVNFIQLIGVIEDNKGLDSIEILLNGVPIIRQNYRGLKIKTLTSSRRYEFNEMLQLESGRNSIEILARDLSGHVTKKDIAIHRNDKKTKVWAVVVGVNSYNHFPHLKYGVQDAQAFSELLLDNNLVEPEHLFFLIDKDANLNNLRNVLGTQLKRKAGKDDMVLIYFAGHGATESDANSPDGDGLEKYLLPVDADPNDLYTTALPMREISHIMKRISSEKLIFIADSCYSGASGGRTVSVEDIRANISDTFLTRIAGAKGRVIISASGPNEVSAESDSLGHGVFTYHLIEAMSGKADYDQDGFVTVDEAYRYVSEEVPKTTGQAQHPVKKGVVEGQLILGVVN